MAKVLLPLILAVLGGGIGVGAGVFLRPPMEESADGTDAADAAPAEEEVVEPPGTRPIPNRDRPPLEERDYVRMNNQFVVPVLSGGEVTSLVVLSVSLETELEMRSVVFSREPKLRAALLQVMFNHANLGGFSGNFTAADRIQVLRQLLWEAARPILGPGVFDVLITDIARQDT